MTHSALPYREATPLPAHFSVEKKLGMKPVLRCVCGQSTTFSESVRNVPGRELRAWLDAHGRCTPRQEQSA